MKERPIIFSGEMVQAILDGRKTQTRRVMKIPPERDQVRLCHWVESGFAHPLQEGDGCSCREIKCPYGKVGDRLWVKETWSTEWDGNKRYICYKARGGKYYDTGVKHTWKSPLFMPREHSRIDLEITNIRVERLQDITEDDAKAEGVQPEKMGVMASKENNCSRLCYRKGFEKLWEKIHGIKCDFDWESSKWVWAIEFRKL